MDILESRKLEKLKQKRIEMFEPYTNTALYKNLSINSNKVQDVCGVKELMTAMNEYEKFIDEITRAFENDQIIGARNFDEAEKKLNRVKECIETIDWNTQC